MRSYLTSCSVCVLTLTGPAVAQVESAAQGVDELELSGDLRAHDPSLIRDQVKGVWYVFSRSEEHTSELQSP